ERAPSQRPGNFVQRRTVHTGPAGAFRSQRRPVRDTRAGAGILGSMRSDSSEPAAGRVCPARALTWVVAFGTSTGTIVATGCAQERALASVSADAGGSRDGGAGAGSGAAEPTDDSLPGSPLAIDLVRGPSFISLHSLQQVNTERSNLDW